MFISANARTLVCLVILLLPCCSAKRFGPEVGDGTVRFQFYAPKAASVAIAGSFNQWDPGKNALAGPDRRGVWTVTLALPEGRYEYLFVLDNKKWQTDPGALSIDDGFGGRNSVVDVGR
jgi:1,4-alpha-glucan branching enzyme